MKLAIIRPVELSLPLVFGLLLAAASGCDTSANGAPPAPSSSAAPVDQAAPRQRALPRLEGVTLEGENVNTDMFRNHRGVIFAFATADRGTDDLAPLIRDLVGEAEGSNIVFLGINRDTNRENAESTTRYHKLGFPVLYDPSRTISSKLAADSRDANVILVDGAGNIIQQIVGFNEEIGVDVYGQVIREDLRRVEPSFGLRAKAPDFTVNGLEGQARELSSLAGKPVALVFFLHTCPHCHEALKFLNRMRSELEPSGLTIVPVSIQANPGAVGAMAKQLEIELPLYLDPGDIAQDAYEHGLGVPEIIVIDRERNIIARHSGYDPRIEALVTMNLRAAAGIENPILMARDAYSGEESCRICHSGQHETWSLTNHAYAFKTLVEHGVDKDPECLPCHTVGWNEPGGYSLSTPYEHLEGVQCENCHGRGGPHQSPEFAKFGYKASCDGCHTPDHSLNFDFASRLPDVSHAINSQFVNLSLEERHALLQRRDKRKRSLFADAEYVGSETCQSCHANEHERWSKGPHAGAFATLEAENESQNEACLQCHTTGFQKSGGFPEGGERHANVGCESCHGPGGNHVGPDAKREGTILPLTEKCGSCAILQICGTCHDDANDPGFEFEVLDKIDAIRHGFRDRSAEAAH